MTFLLTFSQVTSGRFVKVARITCLFHVSDERPIVLFHAAPSHLLLSCRVQSQNLKAAWLSRVCQKHVWLENGVLPIANDSTGAPLALEGDLMHRWTSGIMMR